MSGWDRWSFPTPPTPGAIPVGWPRPPGPPDGHWILWGSTDEASGLWQDWWIPAKEWHLIRLVSLASPLDVDR